MALKPMVWLLIALALMLSGLAAPAWADEAGLPAAATVADTLDPPVALTATTVEYPADAPPHAEPVVVRVKLIVGVDGLVKKVTLLAQGHPAFDRAVVAAAQQFRFRPGLWRGKAVQVEVTFSHTFLPPPPPAAAPPQGGPPLDAVLRGKLVEKGTRAPVARATVSAQLGDRVYSADSDARGRFRLPLPAGQARITVHSGAHKPFLQNEKLESRQELGVAYYIERDRYDPYEILVFGEKRREEVSRVTLRGPEIKQIPGTFGDPFRVVQTLPGVASLMSLLPFPVVRGASPGSTGFLVDGTRVPLLYHLLAGPSVIHPEFIDEVQFYPGNAPVIYGGYTAGVIDGRTRRARADEKLYDIDVNLLQAGGLIRHPVPQLGATATVAGRLGYPGTLMSLATDEASLSYWDYQVRLDGGNARKGWTIFAFGARDELQSVDPAADPTAVNPPLVPALVLGFHRVDLRAHHPIGKGEANWRVVAGIDSTAASTSDVTTKIVEPTARLRYPMTPELEVVAGLEGSYRLTEQGSADAAKVPISTSSFTEDIKNQWTATALTEAIWRPTRDWLIRPGIRLDWRGDGSTDLLAADPRLAVRYRLGELDLGGVTLAKASTETDNSRDRRDRSVWLKAGVGLFHQPPRFFLPLPGLDVLPLSYGLLASIQSSLGVEVPLGVDTSINLETFYNDMDPIVFDLAVNKASVATAAQSSFVSATATDNANRAQQVLDGLFAPQQGRSYGLEALLRRQARSGPYGWISYTFSLSERLRADPISGDKAWVPYDFDRSHLLNVVAGVPLPRNWDFGVRLQYQSGKPATTTYGYNTARTDGYFRADLRIDKRAVWNKWLLDFYIDLANAFLFPEEVSAGSTIRYVLPSVGVRGRL
jgi:TonB family protein